MTTITLRGKEYTDQDVLEAMDQFDRNRRAIFNDWRKWVIKHDGREYPPKKILRIVIPEGRLPTGGEPTNHYFRELGFMVVVRDTWASSGSNRWLSPDDAAEDEPVEYDAQDGDHRDIVHRQIRERRGQQEFRDSLRNRYRDRCLVTGCEAVAVLEAAHIQPYRGDNDNHPSNGLLLRSDIHTLFDLDLLGINPESLQVELHPDIDEEYGEFEDVKLACPAGEPSREALEIRYEQFRQRLHQAG